MMSRKERTRRAIQWVDGPPARGHQRQWSYDLAVFYDEVRSRPGQWACLALGDKNYSTVAAHRLRERHDDLEALARDGDVYARVTVVAGSNQTDQETVRA